MKTASERIKELERMKKLDVRRNELLHDLIDVACTELQGFDVQPDAATLVAHALADRLADFWGGQTICFPRDRAWRLAHKEQAIYDQFNGRNLHELTRSTGMTERGLRKLLDRVRAKQRSGQATDSGFPSKNEATCDPQ